MIAMPEICKAATVPYSPSEMYALVNNIEAYPEFLPWCTAASVLSWKKNGLIASLSVTIGKIEQSFTTENTTQKESRIDMRLIEGPFKYLSGYWQFNPENEQFCRIRLCMNFELKNKIIKHLLDKAFFQIADTLIDSFLQRAQTVYGPR